MTLYEVGFLASMVVCIGFFVYLDGMCTRMNNRSKR